MAKKAANRKPPKSRKEPKPKAPRKRKAEPKAPPPPPAKRVSGRAFEKRGRLKITSVMKPTGSRGTDRRTRVKSVRRAMARAVAARGRAAKPAKGGPRGTPRVKAARKEVKVKDK